MILSLEEAQKLKPDITQVELDALELMVRNRTKNRFQVKGARFRSLTFTETSVSSPNIPSWVKVGDTLQVSATELNDGLYVVESVSGGTVTFKDAELLEGHWPEGYVSLVRYPADIKAGIAKIIEYTTATAGKIGIKSESISRYNVTYFDMTANESMDGYPAYLMEFLSNYEKVGWGM